jgi:hypothetical protein
MPANVEAADGIRKTPLYDVMAITGLPRPSNASAYAIHPSASASLA